MWWPRTVLSFALLFNILYKNDCAETAFTLRNYSKCEGDDNSPMRFVGNMTNIGSNRIFVNGEFLLNEDIASPIEVCYF